MVLAATPAAARVDRRSPLLTYAEARAAASAGALDRASAAFAAALAAAPQSDLIAVQALNHAMHAGDWRLAFDAARALERRGALPPDGRFLLIAEAFRAHDWRAARAQIEAIERDQTFAFTVPVLRAWLAFGSRQGDPLAALAGAGETGAAAGYAAEHRALLKLATGRDDGSELLAAARSAGVRAARLRMAGAALLAGRGQRDGALALLDSDTPSSLAARALIQAGRPVPGAIGTAEAGVGELMVRLAFELGGQGLPAPATMFARLGTRLDAGNSEAWIVAAELLGQQGQHRLAVDLLANVRVGDPFAASAREARIRLLGAGGDYEGALALALQATQARSASMLDWVRLGRVYGALDRQAESAAAFGRALALHRETETGEPEWTLWLMRGGALEQADNWSDARTAFQQAYRLAPEQPLVLNYFGYAQLVRRENVDEAERLIREAHRLAPDNADIIDSLGWALYLRGQVPEAISLLERAAQSEPANVEINEHLGDAYFAAGRRVEARFAWRAAAVYATGADVARIAAKMESGLTRDLAAR